MQASLKQLRYFVAIAEHGKIADAAEYLNISQPALSASLAQLENIWETQLFLRHKAQGVTLTNSGASLLSHCRQLLQQAHSLEDYARKLKQQVTGDIHIGCFSTLGPLFIPQLLKQAHIYYPELNILVTEGDLTEINNDLLIGKLELALSYNIEQHDRIEHAPLADCPPYVLLSNGHSLCHFPTLSLQQLSSEPFVLLDLPHSGNYFLSLFDEIGCEPTIAYRSRNFEMVRSMVAAGLGFSLLNQRPRTEHAYNGGRLKMIPLKSAQAQPLQIVIARHAGLRPSVKSDAVQKLIETAVTREASELSN